ncbi:MAG: transposase [Ferrovum myxofaciens]|nr:transposase [Ferrovum myxofaciens]
MNAIDKLHLDFPFMGSRQLCRALVKQGHELGRLHVRSLMRRMGISALAPQSGTSQRNPLSQERLYSGFSNQGNARHEQDRTDRSHRQKSRNHQG